MTTKKISKTAIAAVGAGALALAASTYYLFGPLGKIHRKKASGWMLKMKGEIVEKLEDAGDVTEEKYHEIVDSIADSYANAGKIAAPELKTFSNELKSHWKNIVKAAQKKPSSKKK